MKKNFRRNLVVLMGALTFGGGTVDAAVDVFPNAAPETMLFFGGAAMAAGITRRKDEK